MSLRGGRSRAALWWWFRARTAANVAEEAVDGVFGPHFDLPPEALVVLGEHLRGVLEEGEGFFGGARVQRLVEVSEACGYELFPHGCLEGREF